MRYFSAVVSNDEVKAACFYPPYYILCSYHYWKNKKNKLKQYISKGYLVFIDSGAFSAEKSNVDICLDDYCRFIKDVQPNYYASLDVIGNHKQTMDNYFFMKDRYNLNPIPTFHLGSSLDDLKEIVKSSNYIALGGLVFGKGLENHCDEVWYYILNNKPKLKVHGFGLTNIELMKRYPWYSVDSSSFKSCKRFGRQNILWGGMNMKTFTEKEYIELLEKEGFKIAKMKNKKKWFIYDFKSSQSYKIYADHLGMINKNKNFTYLTNQVKLF